MKRIEYQLKLSEEIHSHGFSSAGLRSSEEFDLDPFLNLDLFKMSKPTFRPHPHAGFSAVTYMLPESKGSFQNRDSFGYISTINPGDIHWTQAGSGMIHEEVPLSSEVECLGFQIFINLSKKNKQLPPKAFHANQSTLPKLSATQSNITIVSGQYAGLKSPLNDLATPVCLFDVTVKSGSELTLELDSIQNWFLFVISGSGKVSNDEFEKHSYINLFQHQALHLSKEGQQIKIVSSDNPLRLLACGGIPINEPIYWGGPFAMNSEEEVQHAYQRYKRGDMGTLKPSF